MKKYVEVSWKYVRRKYVESVQKVCRKYAESNYLGSTICRKYVESTYENNYFWSYGTPAGPWTKQVSRSRSREKNMRFRSWSRVKMARLRGHAHRYLFSILRHLFVFNNSEHRLKYGTLGPINYSLVSINESLQIRVFYQQPTPHSTRPAHMELHARREVSYRGR